MYYIHVLDYGQGAYFNITLSDELCKLYETYDDLEEFISENNLDEKYGFRLQDSYVMICKKNTIYFKN